MAELRTILTRKIGPLPTWAWIAAGGAGLYLGTRFLRRDGAAPGFGIGGEAPGMFDESLIPVDVTGRAAGGAVGGVDEFGFPIPEPIFVPEPVAPPGTAPERLPGPTQKCSEPTRQPSYKRYKPRFCPDGWHLALTGPCRGFCVRS